MVSTNGINWTAPIYEYAFQLNAITFGNGVWVAAGINYSTPAGAIATSLDASHWTNAVSGTANGLNSVVFGNGRFVIVGNSGTILTSINGTTWARPNSNTSNSLAGVTYGNGMYVAVGLGGTIVTSSNGSTWTKQIGDSFNYYQYPMYGAAYGAGLYVVVGNAGTIFTSSDGVKWNRPSSPGVTRNLGKIIYAKGLFVAGGGAISPDGINWSQQNAGGPGIAFGNGLFVTVGTGNAAVISADGTNWSAKTFSDHNTIEFWNSVAFGKNTFVAVGALGLVEVSNDGTNWTGYPVTSSLVIKDVAYGNNTFVAVSDKGMLYSTSGTNWTDPRPPGLTNLVFLSVAFGNGEFVATGYTSQYNNMIIVTSPDGIHWTRQFSDVEVHYASISYVNRTFFIVGGAGEMVQSGPVVSIDQLQRSGDGSVALSIASPIGQGFHVQASSDLISWSNIFAATNTQPTNQFFDTTATNFPGRYYRTVWP